MFVMNCETVTTEVMRYRNEPGKAFDIGTREFYNAATTVAQPGEELFFPVQCASCSTEVALVDRDEVFHFYNAVASDH